MQFTQLTPDRFEDIKAFFRDVFTKEPWNDDWSDDAQLTAYIDDLIGGKGALTFAMLDDGGDILALSMGRVRHWFTGTEYYIDELCVRTDLQGKGIGSRFIESIEAEIKNMGMTHIFLQTDRDMPAYEFYLRRGFKELEGHVSFAKDV